MRSHVSRPCAALLADGRRLHLQHGPIDLILEACGTPEDVAGAYRRAMETFDGLLDELVGELPLLRRRTSALATPLGRVARRMWRATLPHCPSTFVTPMAAVAGAVADHLLEAMRAAGSLRRGYVNNGGDIALHLAEGEAFSIGICADSRRGDHAATIRLAGADGIGGVATSGWGGRSHSLGIADAVTVVAETAASADAAATLIANAVDLPGSPAVRRRPAEQLSPDSDLGGRYVTVGVEALSREEKERALAGGVRCAERFRARGLIAAAFLCLQGEFRMVCTKAQEKAVRRHPARVTAPENREVVHA